MMLFLRYRNKLNKIMQSGQWAVLLQGWGISLNVQGMGKAVCLSLNAKTP